MKSTKRPSRWSSESSWSAPVDGCAWGAGAGGGATGGDGLGESPAGSAAAEGAPSAATCAAKRPSNKTLKAQSHESQSRLGSDKLGSVICARSVRSQARTTMPAAAPAAPTAQGRPAEPQPSKQRAAPSAVSAQIMLAETETCC